MKSTIRLEDIYQELLRRQFPDPPENEQLAELYTDLTYLDSVYVGFAQRLIAGDKLPNIDIDDIKDLLHDLNLFKKKVFDLKQLEILNEMIFRSELIRSMAIKIKQLG